jgi:hypothetical protein
MQEKESSS